MGLEAIPQIQTAWLEARVCQVLAQRGCPYVIQVHRVALYLGYVFLTMLYTPLTLDRIIRHAVAEGRSMNERVVLLFFTRVFLAIDAYGPSAQEAYGHGVVHGDLKPANLLVGEDGLPRIADWGTTAVCPQGLQVQSPSPVGTRGWMAPEVMSSSSFKTTGGGCEYGPEADL